MRMWLLTVGEYADEHPLGVVRANDVAEARRVAAELTIKRLKADEPDDMVYVSVSEVEDLTPLGNECPRCGLALRSCCYTCPSCDRHEDMCDGATATSAQDEARDWDEQYDAEIWIPPATDCFLTRPLQPCQHCNSELYHQRTGRCGGCGRKIR